METTDLQNQGQNTQAPADQNQTPPSQPTQPQATQAAQPSQVPQTPTQQNPQNAQPRQPGTPSNAANAANQAASQLASVNTQLSKVPDQDVIPPKLHGFAKALKGVATVLGGGQRYTTEIQPDGTTKRTPIPVRGRDLGMAIAISALTGAFAGVGSGGGPNHLGRSAQAGFNAVTQQRQQQQQQQEQQAQGDFMRKQATLKANMEMRTNAIQAGLYDRDVADKWSETYTPLVDSLFTNPEAMKFIVAGSKEAPVSEDEADDIVKHSPFKIDRIPVGGAVPRLNANGQQSWIDPKTGKVVPDNSPGAHPAWDHRFILIKHDANVSLSGPGGPSDWVKSVVNSPFAPWIEGASPALVRGNGASGTVPTATAIGMLSAVSRFELMQHTLDQFAETLNEGKEPSDKGYIQPIKLTEALKKGTVDPSTIQAFMNSAGVTSNPNSTELNTRIDAVSKQNQKAGAKLIALFGNDTLNKYKEKYLADKKAEERAAKPMDPNVAKDIISDYEAGKNVDPTQLSKAQTFMKLGEDESVNKETRIAQSKEELEQRYQKEQDDYLTTPDNWGTADVQRIADMTDSFEARKALQAAGVKVPLNFAELWNVGHDHGKELRSAFPTRVSKGTGQMDAQHAGTFIDQFINPHYSDNDFTAAREFNKGISDPAKSPVVAAGVASQHLQLLEEAAKELGNDGVLQNNPLFNSLRQFVNVQVGDPAPRVFKAILDKVNQEVEKVAAGRPALQSEMDRTNKNLDWSQPIQTINGVLNSYMGLMAGRLNELNDQNQHYFSRDLHVNPIVTQLYRTHGFDTPWDKRTQQQLVDERSKAIINNYTLPPQFGGGHPTKVVFGKNGQTLLSNGKVWIDKDTGQQYNPPQAPQQ